MRLPKKTEYIALFSESDKSCHSCARTRAARESSNHSVGKIRVSLYSVFSYDLLNLLRQGIIHIPAIPPGYDHLFFKKMQKMPVN